MSEVIYKINPIEDYLVANEYEKQKERVKYEKPRYLKGKKRSGSLLVLRICYNQWRNDSVLENRITKSI